MNGMIDVAGYGDDAPEHGGVRGFKSDMGDSKGRR